MPRLDLLAIERTNRLTVQTQHGCPFRCEFCAESYDCDSITLWALARSEDSVIESENGEQRRRAHRSCCSDSRKALAHFRTGCSDRFGSQPKYMARWPTILVVPVRRMAIG